MTSSELNDKLEAEFRKTPHPKSFIFKLIGFILFIPIFFPYTRNGDSCINFRFFMGGVCICLFMVASLMDKRVVTKGGSIHKEAHPIAYRLYIGFLIVAVGFCFYCGLSFRN